MGLTNKMTSLISGSMVKGENHLPKMVLWFWHACPHSHTQIIYTQSNNNKFFLNQDSNNNKFFKNQDVLLSTDYCQLRKSTLLILLVDFLYYTGYLCFRRSLWLSKMNVKLFKILRWKILYSDKSYLWLWSASFD